MEIVRRMYEASDREDFATVVALFEPEDHIWDMSHFQDWLGQSEFRGVDGFLAFLSEWLEPYEEWKIGLERARDAGGPKVATAIHQQGRLRGSTSWVELRYGIVYTVERGRIQRAEVYATAEEALEAAGLSE